MKKWSIKVIVGSTTLGLVALGTGISLASTHTKAALGPVTCIVTADAAAAVDAGTALSDVFAVGTKLHFSSAGRTVDVTVSAPLTKAAAPATSAAADPSADPSSAAPTSAAATSAAPTDAPTSAAATSAAPGGSTAPGKKHTSKRAKKRQAARAAAAAAAAKNAAAATKAADAKKTADAVNSMPQVEVAGANDGVDPNTVCTELSKNAFNTLGGVVNGNNVGAFIAQMTPVADGGAGQNGNGQNGAGQSAAATQ
jgi:hypothetical protein